MKKLKRSSKKRPTGSKKARAVAGPRSQVPGPLVVVVEDDPFPRLIQVILDPATSVERMAAFTHFFAHEEPNFSGWCERLRKRLKRLYPAEVRLVSDQAALAAALPGAHVVVSESLKVGKQEIAAAGRTLR